MPRDTPRANVVECEQTGAHVTLMDGLITDCGRLVREGHPLEPPGEDGRLRLPLDALDALDAVGPARGSSGLEFEVVDSEIRIRRKGEPGRA